jgi:hypothetical protein
MQHCVSKWTGQEVKKKKRQPKWGGGGVTKPSTDSAITIPCKQTRIVSCAWLQQFPCQKLRMSNLRVKGSIPLPGMTAGLNGDLLVETVVGFVSV